MIDNVHCAPSQTSAPPPARAGAPRHGRARPPKWHHAPTQSGPPRPAVAGAVRYTHALHSSERPAGPPRV